MIYRLLRLVLFQFDAEISHRIALCCLKFFYRCGILRFTRIEKPVEIMGLRFPNPVGLAAGLDKNAEYIDALAALGFGFIEVGTITPRPQPGNPKPRLYRLPPVRGLINRMGFNSKGLEYAIHQIKRSKYQGILGINIGKNFDTPNDRALDDYLIGLRAVYPYASYITVNISSPNTEGLRELQFGEYLNHLLENLKSERQKLSRQYHKIVPLVVKIAPDLTEEEIQNIASCLLKHEIDGVCAVNTTLSREGITELPQANERGGLSGAPLFNKAVKVVTILTHCLKGKIPIIAVGGICKPSNAKVFFAAGASLVQLYTGFIYEGPRLIKLIVEN